MADFAQFDKNYRATAPPIGEDMSDEALNNYHRYFVDILPVATSATPNARAMAEGRIALLQAEIAHRRIEKRSDRQHGQTQCLARWAIAVGSLGVVVGIVFGILQCRANKPPASPNSFDANSEQTTAPPASISPLATTQPTTPANPAPTMSAPLGTPPPQESVQLSPTP